MKLKDVALSARVSCATVSRIVNGRGRVSLKTEKRVKEAAAKLGVPLRPKNKTNIIAFVLSNRNMLHPVYSHVLAGAEAHGSELDYHTLFLSFRYPIGVAGRDLRVPPILRRRDVVDGLIVAGVNSQSFLDFLSDTGVPFAVIGNSVLGDWRHDSQDVVWVDDIHGAHELTLHLQSLGHRDIWFVANCRLPWFARRYEGYRRAMAEAGLNPRSHGIDAEQQWEVGYLATKSILARPEPVSAIVAGDDLTAQGVYQAARDRGLHIPEDLSVAGFDDSPEAAGLHPPLTTMRVFAEQVGKQLTDLVLNRIAQPDLVPRSRTIPTMLVKRESCSLLIPQSALTPPRAPGVRG